MFTHAFEMYFYVNTNSLSKQCTFLIAKDKFVKQTVLCFSN